MDVRSAFARCAKDGWRLMPEDEGKALLARYGFPVPEGRRVSSPEEVAALAGSLAYPVVVKAMGPELIHKSDLGAVRVGIGDGRALAQTCTDLWKAFPGAPLLVEAMAAPGVELILGLQCDPHFGPCLMVGSGGVLTDLLRDVGFVMLPATREEIRNVLFGLKGHRLLTGYRGKPPCDIEKILDAAEALGRFGAETLGLWESVDVNPLVARPDGVCALDVKVLIEREPKEISLEAPRANPKNLEPFFNPKSVAVIGASSVPGKVAYVIMDSLVNHDYRGAVYPVNPKAKELFGLPCYPSLEAVPHPVELVIVVVDLALVPGLLETCKAKGVPAMLVISGGGKELGGERAELEGRVRAKAKETGVRLVGPNCIGSFGAAARFDTFFQSHERLVRPPEGPLAMTAQSGTYGCLFLEAAAETLGCGKLVSYGNRADVDESDLVEHMAHDPKISVIASYVEGLTDGRKYVQTVRRVIRETGKPCVVMKQGRTPEGAKAAMGHTGSYGGTYEVYRDCFRQHGVIDTDAFDEFFGACKALATQPVPRGNRVAFVSNGAGPMVGAIDLFAVRGLELAVLSRESVRAMRERYKFFYMVENPVDVTGSATAEDYAFAVEQFMKDPAVDIVMPWFVFADTPLEETCPALLGELLRKYRKPILGGAAGGPYARKMSAMMEREGIPMYESLTAWTQAARALVLWSRYRTL